MLIVVYVDVSQHGPINSWDRVPFLTTVAHGYPSYDAAYTEVHHNFIFANYGFTFSNLFLKNNNTVQKNRNSKVIDTIKY